MRARVLFPAPLAPEQRMYLAGKEVQVDMLENRCGVTLAELAQGENRLGWRAGVCHRLGIATAAVANAPR